MSKGKGKGVVAAGHELTAQAAAEILQDGGNAFDLLVWDGAADQPLARQVAKPMVAGVVNSAP